MGVIYQPVTKELFTAARGEGAFLNEKRIQVSKHRIIFRPVYWPLDFRASSARAIPTFITTGISRCARMECAATAPRRLDLASVACGRFDGFWEFGLHSWDTAAGVLLVREAGGVVTNFSGQPYRPGDYETLASNGRIHAEMRQVASDIQEQIGERPGNA